MTNAYVFDAYGTLFDVHAAIARHRAAAGSEADRFSEIWRAKQLEYTWTLTLAGHYVDFWTLTERALDFAFARVPSVDRGLRPKLLEAYLALDAYPDARAALTRLKAQGARLAILSNGTPRMLTAAVETAGMDGLFDALLSVDTTEGLCAGDWCPRLAGLGSDVRVVEPLGRHGRRIVRLRGRLDQSLRYAGGVRRVCRTTSDCQPCCAGQWIKLQESQQSGSAVFQRPWCLERRDDLLFGEPRSIVAFDQQRYAAAIIDVPGPIHRLVEHVELLVQMAILLERRNRLRATRTGIDAIGHRRTSCWDLMLT
jgi:2-haloalkanoic acid dehalogenase type II